VCSGWRWRMMALFEIYKNQKKKLGQKKNWSKSSNSPRLLFLSGSEKIRWPSWHLNRSRLI
jgi:hypothetical protein